MCTYLTEQIKVTGSGKGADGWFGVTDASVYFDHPVHAPAEHTPEHRLPQPGPGPVGAGRGGAHRRVGPGAGQGDRGRAGVGPARAA